MTAQSVLEHLAVPDEPVRVVEWVPVEPAPDRPPVPVLGPYLGVLGSALCALTGSWLLLAPYALDFRHGAETVPRATVVDLATGAAAVVLGLAAAALFGAALARRMRTANGSAAATDPESTAMSEFPAARSDGDGAFDADATGVGSGRPPAAGGCAATDAATDGASAPSSVDPADSLRDLLTPLVAALAADLRSRDGLRNWDGLSSRDGHPPDPAASSSVAAPSAPGPAGPDPDPGPAADSGDQDRYRQTPRFPSPQARDPYAPPTDDQSAAPPHRLPRTPPPRSEW